MRLVCPTCGRTLARTGRRDAAFWVVLALWVLGSVDAGWYLASFLRL